MVIRCPLAVMCLMLILATTTLVAAPSPTPKPEKDEKKVDVADKDDSTQKENDEESQEEEEDEPDRYFAITGATVHTITRGVLFNTSILTKNGIILRIGTGLELPEDEELEILDASGYHVYPGLVAVNGGNTRGSEPPDDSSDVYSLQTVLGLAGGITTVVAGNTATKLTFDTTEDMIVKRDLFVTLTYNTRSADARRKLRLAMEKARQYLRDREVFQEAKRDDPDAKEPDELTGDASKYLKLIKQEAVAIVDAQSAHDLIDLCDLAQQYRIKIVVRGVTEGWTVAPRMARAGLSAILTPRRQIFSDMRINRPNGSSIENAAILYNHGVPLAIIPRIGSITTWGLAGRDLLHLNMEAAFAVRGGLPEEAALMAITIDAARLLGVDHRVGSIEVGKDADFAITDGDLLHYMTHTRWTIVNGKVAYDKQKDSLFNHIRPDGDLNAPPPDDHWPRRLGD